MSWIDVDRKAADPEKPYVVSESEIEQLLDNGDRNAIAQVALSGPGLLTSKIRRRAWPLLLGIDSESAKEYADIGVDVMDSQASKPANKLDTTPLEQLLTVAPGDECRDEAQVRLDVERSFVYYPEHPSMPLRVQLMDVIRSVLKRNPGLAYYQGYHDVAQVVLLVMGSTKGAVDVLERLSLHVLRDFMLPSLDPTIAHLAFLEALTTVLDPLLGEILHTVQPYYALSATITLFSHNMRSFGAVCRIFDFVLAHGSAAATLYVVPAFVSYERRRVKEAAADPDSVHATLCNLGEHYDGDNNAVYDDVLAHAARLEAEVPLSSISVHWKRLSPHSALVVPGPPAFDNDAARTLLQSHTAELEAASTRPDKPAKHVIRHNHPRLAKAGALIRRSPLLVPHALLGVSVCFGVLGIAAAYRHDIRSVWGLVASYMTGGIYRDRF